MEVETSTLTGLALNWAVATCKGGTGVWHDTVGTYWIKLGGKDRALSNGWSKLQSFSPCTDWAVGGPILSEARISRTIDHSGLWIAYWTSGYVEGDAGRLWMQCDRDELTAGLRCFVAIEMGHVIDIPSSLLTTERVSSEAVKALEDVTTQETQETEEGVQNEETVDDTSISPSPQP